MNLVYKMRKYNHHMVSALFKIVAYVPNAHILKIISFLKFNK